MNPYSSPAIPGDTPAPVLDWTNVLAVLWGIAVGVLTGATLDAIFDLPIGPR